MEYCSDAAEDASCRMLAAAGWCNCRIGYAVVSCLNVACQLLLKAGIRLDPNREAVPPAGLLQRPALLQALTGRQGMMQNQL
jgi:hypothetical protein